MQCGDAPAFGFSRCFSCRQTQAQNDRRKQRPRIHIRTCKELER